MYMSMQMFLKMHVYANVSVHVHVCAYADVNVTVGSKLEGPWNFENPLALGSWATGVSNKGRGMLQEMAEDVVWFTCCPLKMLFNPKTCYK